MASKAPSNTDIVKLLTINHEENSKRLDAIETQVKHTNGRVKALETIQQRNDAVEAYKLSQGAQSSSNPKLLDGWDWKVVLAILMTLATAILGFQGVVK